MEKNLIIISIVMLFAISCVLVQAQAGDIGTLRSTTAANPPDEVNIFNPGDEVYVLGLGLLPNAHYDVWIVPDQINWVLGMPLPLAVPGTIVLNIVTDGFGNFPKTLIWTSATPGKYDIIADCQQVGAPAPGTTPGLFDAFDSLDDFETQVTAGFFVIPEIPLGTVMGLFACFAAFYVKRKKF